ncbi:DUF3598 family protein [Nostoc sp. JL23]|uniref:DUF3598 family protein n=1 Tax=Nostoc sp. JL23 TaxID=2815394 RepID=UPI001D860410|nr:DUF3598 family protein [Nostoc sp. JL23]MBN3877286.1 DUF3598 family protein [Nostoc sp. JL23]
MDAKERNWNYCTNHLLNWHGIWTRYTPVGDVKESFQSLRSFKSNPEKTKIVHTNTYIYTNGENKQESWEFNFLSNSLDNGLFHPSRETMRGYFFAEGHATWATVKLKPNSYFGIELFFRYEDLRHSVGIVYDESGNLFHTANIREDCNGFPSKYWSTELNQLPERNFSGNWQGISMTITPNLKISEPIVTQFNWHKEGHKYYYLPDGVSINCHSSISIGTPFSVIANWLINNSEMHQLIANYDELGVFSSLTLETFLISNV